ncbi:MAG: flavodoxin family protein [Deltaproteobacteria bacterium]|nr:flavodoxin family protein [Deltaproteobacteria bacterium]
MINILAIYGSPRRNGNTSLLLREAVKGARDRGAAVNEVVLRDLHISPCLEIYACKKTGRCAIKDDFQSIYDQLLASDGLMLASPIFFYAVSAHTKTLMDRCQSLWVKRHYLDKKPYGKQPHKGKAIFISVGATKGRKLFDGPLLNMRYFLEALDMELWKSLLYRGLDCAGDVLKHPDYLAEAYRGGCDLYAALLSSVDIE